jgi:hypothetical protein
MRVPYIFVSDIYIHTHICVQVYNSLTDSWFSTVSKGLEDRWIALRLPGGEEILLIISCPQRFRLHPVSRGPFLWSKASTVSSEALPPNAEVKNARSYAYIFRASCFVSYWEDCTFHFMLLKRSSLLMYCAELVASLIYKQGTCFLRDRNCMLINSRVNVWIHAIVPTGKHINEPVRIKHCWYTKTHTHTHTYSRGKKSSLTDGWNEILSESRNFVHAAAEHAASYCLFLAQ